jgi:large subunit ribosomal protein L24
MKIKKGDQVEVISGNDRGRKGKVLKVLPQEDKVIVKGINVAKKHVKPSEVKGQEGGILKVEKPIKASKVMVICPQCKETTRVGYQVDKNGEKHRVCKKCDSLLSTGGEEK